MKKRRSSHNRDIIGAAQRGAGGLPRYWGTMMTDSIDLLEAVGRDASLRHLPPDELARRLKAAGASEELAGAVVERSSALLSKEFGLSLIHISEPTRPSHISRMPSSA